MNIYRISQTVSKGYDTYDSAVVVAATEKLASETYPSTHYSPIHWDGCDWIVTYEDGRTFKRGCGEWAVNPEQVKVELIGIAVPELVSGVLVSSYNAG